VAIVLPGAIILLFLHWKKAIVHQQRELFEPNHIVVFHAERTQLPANKSVFPEKQATSSLLAEGIAHAHYLLCQFSVFSNKVVSFP
jgi:hypothetical protein